MKENGDGHLEEARSLSCFLMQICLISRHFLGTLAEMGPVHWVGAAMNVSGDGYLEGARSFSRFSM